MKHWKFYFFIFSYCWSKTLVLFLVRMFRWYLIRWTNKITEIGWLCHPDISEYSFNNLDNNLPVGVFHFPTVVDLVSTNPCGHQDFFPITPMTLTSPTCCRVTIVLNHSKTKGWTFKTVASITYHNGWNYRVKQNDNMTLFNTDEGFAILTEPAFENICVGTSQCQIRVLSYILVEILTIFRYSSRLTKGNSLIGLVCFCFLFFCADLNVF